MVTLARAGIPDLIGLSWYFVRVHDAVQVCLSHLQTERRSDDDNSPELPKRASHAHYAPWRQEASRSDSERSSLITDGAV